VIVADLSHQHLKAANKRTINDFRSLYIVLGHFRKSTRGESFCYRHVDIGTVDRKVIYICLSDLYHDLMSRTEMLASL